jgi:hypothetical protein
LLSFELNAAKLPPSHLSPATHPTGTLLALPRPEGHVERRADGFSEPELVLLVATAHVSRRSASVARRVVEVVRPGAVVLELCGSRKSVLAVEEDDDEEEVEAASSSSSSSPPDRRKVSNPFALSGSIARSASLGGAPAMALRLLLARKSDAVLEAALRRSESESEGDAEASSSSSSSSPSSSSSSSSSSSAYSRRPGVESRAAAAGAFAVGYCFFLSQREVGELCFARLTFE